MSIWSGLISRRRSQGRFGVSLLIGLALTALAAGGEGLGLWQPVERIAADWRWRYAANHTPDPSDRVVHVDIDDLSLARTGRWPWPRTYLAHVVDELHRAGARVIAFDLLLDDPQRPRAVPVEPATTDANTAADAPAFRLIEDDRRLVRSVERAGNVVAAMVASREAAEGPVARRSVAALEQDPAIDAEALIERLGLAGEEATFVRDSINLLKERAVRARLQALAEQRGQLPSVPVCRELIFPEIDAAVRDAAEINLLQRQHEAVRSLGHLRRATVRSHRGDDPVSVRTPLWPLTRAAAGVGSVTYEADPDGHVRSVPLWVSDRGRLYPHFALVIACHFLDVPLGSVRVTDEATILPGATWPDGTRGEVRVPMLAARPGDGWGLPRDRVMVPWPSNAQRWERLFDPGGESRGQHISIGTLVEAPDERADLAHNELQADLHAAAILNQPLLQGFGIAELKADYIRLIAAREAGALTAAEVGQRAQLRQAVLDKAEQVLGMFEGLTDLADDERALKQTLTRHAPYLALHMAEAQRGREAIASYERRLREQVEGAACLIGWTATGSIADFVPTWLDERTPGVVIHGAVLNGILTRHFVDRAPPWLDAAMVVLVGVLVSIVTALVAPIRALAIAGGVVAAFLAVNAFVAFDRLDVQVAAAGPGITAALAWMSITVYRLVLEQRERARITKQFKNYVSRDLVDLIVADPSLIKQGRHELTCMFSDIAGFTSVSERLGPEQTIGLLNEYLRAMTHEIMDGRGTVNKYLGDGIMAFWGAPLDDDQHTLNACRSMLRCIGQMDKLGEDERFGDLPRLFMRVGIATGPMMVGDCGAPPDRSDYTVIGDTVNLASRLESSNKQFGTQVLLNRRTHELVAGDVLARQVGRIVVVGRDQPEPVYELLAMADHATDAQRRFAADTDAAVAAYVNGAFDEAVKRFEQFAERYGPSPLIDLYIGLCRTYVEAGPPEDFRGEIVLTQK